MFQPRLDLKTGPAGLGKFVFNGIKCVFAISVHIQT